MDKRCFLRNHLNCAKSNNLFPFPFNKLNLLAAWLKEIPKHLYVGTNPLFICDSHFDKRFISIRNGVARLNPEAVPTIFNCGTSQSSKQEEKKSSCRFCLKKFQSDGKEVEINNYIKMQFFVVTDSELSCSEHLSQIICDTCFNLTCDYATYKKKLLANQKKLEAELVSPKMVPKTAVEVIEIKDEPEECLDDNLVEITEPQTEETTEILIEEHLDPSFENCQEEVVVPIKDPKKKPLQTGKIRDYSKEKVCPDCYKTYSIHAFKRHYERVHLQKKNFHCDHCGYRSYTRNHMENHVRIHFNVKLYFCELCGAGFGNDNLLRGHYLSHQKERPFQCKQCFSEFKSTYALNRHLKTHSEPELEKLFVCEVCRDNWHLKRHMLMHQPMRQTYCCGFCGKLFGSDERLKAHQIYHNPPLFRCDFKDPNCNDSGGLCNKQFFKKSDLNSHKKTHEGAKDFHCNYCTNSYYKNAHLKRHMKSHHPEMLQ